MTPQVLKHHPVEVELKLALPTDFPARLARELARTPLLARRKAVRQQLHNVYYDTPEQLLYQKRVALRLRRIGDGENSQWLQTLKMGGSGDSALSKRGEWETTIPGAELVADSLTSTPWSTIDPDGAVFQALVPRFVTSFERTSWSVRRRDGSLVEVAFDLGQIVAGQKAVPICELELELISGELGALFDLAQQIATSIAVLPVSSSKAERGYALAQDSLDVPLRAQPPRLIDDLSVPSAAGSVLREMFSQFTVNLNALRSSDDPEVVHQARVGWRRFKSALWLFRPTLVEGDIPSWRTLKPPLTLLGELRDLDVALHDTLPKLAEAYIASDPRRLLAWDALTHTLQQTADLVRKSVREELRTPATGVILLATTQWLEALSTPKTQGETTAKPQMVLRDWAKQRIARLHKRLKAACKNAGRPETQHRARILAKRLRYSSEAMKDVLPKKRTERLRQQAARLQADLGAARDVMHAGVLAAKLNADSGLIEFLRGIASGMARRK